MPIVPEITGIVPERVELQDQPLHIIFKDAATGKVMLLTEELHVMELNKEIVTMDYPLFVLDPFPEYGKATWTFVRYATDEEVASIKAATGED